jgi:hypothetical protein
MLLIAPVLAKDGMELDSVDNAVSLRKEGQAEASVSMLKRLKLTDERNVRINLELAISYMKSRQFEQAQYVVDYVLTLTPAMKDNKKLQRLKRMIRRSQRRANMPEHQFKGEIIAYKGTEELTQQSPYYEITEFEDYYQIERKSDVFSNNYYYTAARLKGEYRYTPKQSLKIFDRGVYAFWSNRITYFHKQRDTLDKANFGFTSLDSALFVIQPRYWAFNAKLKGKWHHYEGNKTLTEQSADVNGSLLFYGARFKLGIRQKNNDLDTSFIEDNLDSDLDIYEQKIKIITPYVALSYRFSPSLLWSVGSRRRNIHADNELLEGKVINYNSTIKFIATDALNLHLSYHHDDLSYDVVDLDEGLNSGELKRTFTFGGGYKINEHWQVGINALYVDKKQDNDAGQDQWKRLEGFIRYRF